MGNISPVKVKVDLTQATTNTVDTFLAPIRDIHKGIKKIFVVCTGKRFADMERPTVLAAAQTEKDVEDIKAGKKEFRDGNLIPIGPVVNVGDYYREISAQNSACDAKRLGEAMLDAAIELKEIPEEDISDDPVDQTFFNHWRKEAELIDDEELRKWWAHLLVEETKKPKSISPRTLDVAKNLSKDEANLFVQISKGIVDDVLVVDSKGFPASGTYSEIIALQDACLICSQTSNRTVTANASNQRGQKVVALLFPESELAIVFEKETISFQCNFLTVAGREIVKITHVDRALDNFRRIAEVISKQNDNVVASIIPIKAIGADVSSATSYRLIWIPIWINHPEGK